MSLSVKSIASCGCEKTGQLSVDSTTALCPFEREERFFLEGGLAYTRNTQVLNGWYFMA